MQQIIVDLKKISWGIAFSKLAGSQKHSEWLCGDLWILHELQQLEYSSKRKLIHLEKKPPKDWNVEKWGANSSKLIIPNWHFIENNSFPFWLLFGEMGIFMKKG